MAGIGLTPCRSMAAENIRDLPRRAGHGRGLLRPAQRADSIDTHRQTPILDEVDDTSILKTGTQPRYPRSPSWLICTGASPQPPLSRSDLVLWRYPDLIRRAERVGSARVLQTSTCSAIARASSTSMPRYLTVLSILVWPSKSCTARRLACPPVDQGCLGSSQ